MSAKGNILVSGGAGYIGSHAVLALIEAGWQPVVIDNLSTGFRWALPDGVPLIEGDIGDGDLLRRVMHDHSVMGVMHFAGSIIVPESISEPLKYYGNNTGKSRTLIEAAVDSGVRHFIFSSTAATYGTPETPVVGEDAPQRPINPYGASKLMTEWMLRDVAFAHDLNYGVLRYFNVAGADPLARTGQSTAGATHLIKVAVEAALGKRDFVQIFGRDFDTPDGTGVRDYIHVSDLAAAHVLLLEALVADPAKSMTFNCGYGRGYSVVEVLDAVDRVTHLQIERRWADRRPGDPAMLVADSRAIQRELGWTPRHADLDTIVAHALQWERALKERRA